MTDRYSKILKQMEAYKIQFLKDWEPIFEKQREMLPSEIEKDLYTLDWKFNNNKIRYEDYIARKIYLEMLLNGTYTLADWRKQVNSYLSY